LVLIVMTLIAASAVGGLVSYSFGKSVGSSAESSQKGTEAESHPSIGSFASASVLLATTSHNLLSLISGPFEPIDHFSLYANDSCSLCCGCPNQ
jgi:membrane protein YqaA with SNARE-associated domain